MPTARNYDPAVTGKTQKPSMWDYVEVLRDVRVVVMIFQYSACFGTDPCPLSFRFHCRENLCSCSSRSLFVQLSRIQEYSLWF